jgi:hypothetical protein
MGHRAAVRLSDGSVIEERPGLGRVRADEVARMVDGLVASVEAVEVSSSDQAELGDWRRRRVSIEVLP